MHGRLVLGPGLGFEGLVFGHGFGLEAQVCVNIIVITWTLLHIVTAEFLHALTTARAC